MWLAVSRFLRTTVTQKKTEQSRPLRNADGKEDEALAIIRAHRSDSTFNLVERLKAAGIQRGKSWVSWKRKEMASS